MKIRHILTLSIFLPLSVAWAQTVTVPPAMSQSSIGKPDPAFRSAAFLDEQCRQSPDDPFEIPARVSEFSHSYGYMCLDTKLMRPLRLLKKLPKQIRIANFQHEGKFWVADIPTQPQAWDKAIFHVVNFPSVPGVSAAHAQIRFKLNPNYKIFLRSQEGSENIVLSDIIFTSQTSRILNVPDNMILGTYDNYPIVTRGISPAQRLRESKNIVNQYELTLNKEEVASLVVLAIQGSQSRGFSTFYNILRPNCATDIFDLLGRLPRFSSRQQQFYTVLSADPIAGPSLQALEERGVLGKRIADLGDELAGRNIIAPKPVNPNMITYFRNSLKTPYSFVVVEPQTTYNMEPIRAKLRIASEKAVLALPQIVQSMGAASLEVTDPKKILVQSLSQVHRDLIAFLTSVNSSLPVNEPVYVMAYLTPWKGQLSRVNLLEQKIPAELPFSMVTYERATANKMQQIYGSMYGFMTAHQVTESNKRYGSSDHIFFIGAALHLKLQRDKSTVTIQVLNSLNAQTLNNIETKNKKINIHSLVIPKIDPLTTNRPTMLITYSQKYNRLINTEVDFQFGGLGSAEATGPRRGYLRIMTELSCYRRSAVVPHLAGNFGKSASGYFGVDNYMTGKPVNIDFYSLRFELRDKLITGGDVRMNAPSILKQCTTSDRFKDEVLGELNAVIDSSIDSAEEKFSAESILDALLSNRKLDVL